MVKIQLLTGCRPDEVCRIRPRDVDTRCAACWIYRPGSEYGQHGQHKSAHHKKERAILIGPKCQDLLRQYLNASPTSYCFSPLASEVARNARRRSNRMPTTPSTRATARRPDRKTREPSERYTTSSFRRSIARAWHKADKKARAESTLLTDNVRVPAWSLNRLRNNRATALRAFGLDLTKTILGHARVETTQFYAEKDLRAAMDLVGRIG